MHLTQKLVELNTMVPGSLGLIAGVVPIRIE